MRPTRWRVEAALAVTAGVVMVVVGGGAVWFISKKPVHVDAAAVPSPAATAHTDRYSGPVDQWRRLARNLVPGHNLPGLPVAAVAVDGEIVWADGPGWADVDNRTAVTPAQALPSRRSLEAPTSGKRQDSPGPNAIAVELSRETEWANVS